MLSPQALMRAIVQRLLPSPFTDDRDNDRSLRGGRYGELYVLPIGRKQHNLAEEGSYFVTQNAQSGIVTALLGAAFAETTLSPVLHIVNTDSGDKGKSIFLDYLNLIVTTVGAAASAATNLLFAWTLDQSDRYTSGGTDLTAGAAAGGGTMSPNSGVSKRSSIAQIYFGGLTLAAASSKRRIIVPQRLLRVQNSATVVGALQDEARMNFGGVEHPNPSSLLDLTTAKTVGYREHFQLPPLVIGPGHNATLHIWSPGQALSTGVTYLPEMGHWER